MIHPEFAVAAYQRARHRAEACSNHAKTFRDPAWNMLLCLAVNQAKQTRISISGLCCASLGPETTALRLVNVLERKGLLMRVPDLHDGRRDWVSLTDAGEVILTAALRLP